MITREKVPVEGLLESYEAALMQTGYNRVQYHHKAVAYTTGGSYDPAASERRHGVF